MAKITDLIPNSSGVNIYGKRSCCTANKTIDIAEPVAKTDMDFKKFLFNINKFTFINL